MLVPTPTYVSSPKHKQHGNKWPEGRRVRKISICPSNDYMREQGIEPMALLRDAIAVRRHEGRANNAGCYKELICYHAPTNRLFAARLTDPNGCEYHGYPLEQTQEAAEARKRFKLPPEPKR